MVRNIGINVKPPENTCDDEYCPFHGHLSIRGQIHEGVVVSTKMYRTVVVRKDYSYYVKTYDRYERRQSKFHAHLPPCIDVKDGDKVRIAECRPLSKTVSFVVIENLSKQ